MRTPPSIPNATYRLQLRREFPLSAVTDLVPYLHRLGVSDLYLSPIYTARQGSVHGYDIVDHRNLNPELGDETSLQQLLDTLTQNQLGVILDIVPNHMCIAGDENHLWQDVLEDGRDSPSASHFDIDWDPPKHELVGKVLLPFLSEQYGRVLEGQLVVALFEGRFFVNWEGKRLPLTPSSWHHILEPALAKLRIQTSPEDAAVIELESILRALTQTLPAMRTPEGLLVADYRHEKESIRRRLTALEASSQAAGQAIRDAIDLVNGTREKLESFDRLEHLMADQWYRLANWRVAAHEINYRRFFDVNELAAVRVENPAVFADVHALAFGLGFHPALTGFRIDHVDGLSDPKQYLEDLDRGFCSLKEDARSPFVVVEKILGPRELLPNGWLAHGTTGYDFIPILADLFTHREGATKLRAIAESFCGPLSSFRDIAYESKRLVLQVSLTAELTVLARCLARISEQHRYTRDFTLHHLQAALGEVIACFTMYRTYIRPEDTALSEQDTHLIVSAVHEARRRNPLIHASLFDFIQSVLLRQDPSGLKDFEREERATFITRFQQLTGPVVAKGVEDTAFYRYLPLIALNEVGGDPKRMGASIEEIHRALSTRAEATPHTLSATATHDTKRGEDSRARLFVLSERAETWMAATAEWSRINAQSKTTLDDEPAPGVEEEYFIYQTLAGAWPVLGLRSEPDFAHRIRAYMTKARHEAKLHTSWINPHPAYHAAADQFIDSILSPDRGAIFIKSFEAFVFTLLRPGFWNSLSQVILKIAAPGIPDFYQGSELWDFSLVDPDNRRVVDFAHRRRELDALFTDFEARGLMAIDSWFDNPQDGRIKMWVTASALRLRRAQSLLFLQGLYRPLVVHGTREGHAFAFARTDGNNGVIALVGRFFATLGAERPTGNIWKDTNLELPQDLRGRKWRETLTGTLLSSGDSLPLGSVFAHLPVAFLESVT